MSTVLPGTEACRWISSWLRIRTCICTACLPTSRASIRKSASGVRSATNARPITGSLTWTKLGTPSAIPPEDGLRKRSNVYVTSHNALCLDSFPSGLIGFSLAHLALQPGFGQPPVAVNRVGRNLQHFGGLFHTQSSEEAEFNDLALPQIDFAQSFEGIVQLDQVSAFFLRTHQRFVECDLGNAASALLVATRAGGIYQNSPHQLRGDRKEM